MTPTDIAALATALAALATAGYQWLRLFGAPFRHGRNGRTGHNRHRAWLHYLEDRLAAAEHALDDCLQLQSPHPQPPRPQTPSPQRHRTQPDRWRHHTPTSPQRASMRTVVRQ